jgi:toxin-antitoxin system PIN domain toxin
MILVDANLLLYAEDSQAALHAGARDWWDTQLSGDDPVCLCWTVLTAFVRIGTNPRVYQRPLTIPEALERVQSWLEQPCVRIIHATGRHLDVFGHLLAAGQATANLVPDAHLAALAIEHGCVLYSTDGDFARCPGLAWKNPLA